MPIERPEQWREARASPKAVGPGLRGVRSTLVRESPSMVNLARQ
jgi:hypothetical protein